MGSIVSFGSGASGYLAPAASGSGPGIVVIQEWWGLVPHIKEVCDRFSSEGFTALAPDLFHGETTTEPDVASKKMMELDIPRATQEIGQAVTFLRQHEATNGKVAVTGFCMGGAITFTVAATHDIDAAVPFYGLPSADPGYDHITCPVLAHVAEHDGWVSMDKVEPVIARLRARGIDATAHLYPGTEHAFFNDHRPEVFSPDAAKLAWERTIGFLNAHIR